MSVYFIQAEGRPTDPIKIGLAQNVPARVKELQTGYPYKLVVLGTIDGAGNAEEKELHRRFKDLRLHGEWFSPAPALVDFIRSQTAILCDYCGQTANAIHLLPDVATANRAVLACKEHDPGGYWFYLKRLSEMDWADHISQKSCGHVAWALILCRLEYQLSLPITCNVSDSLERFRRVEREERKARLEADLASGLAKRCEGGLVTYNMGDLLRLDRTPEPRRWADVEHDLCAQIESTLDALTDCCGIRPLAA